MIDGLCIRSFERELAITGDGRTVQGMLAPYNEIARVDDGFGPYYETFEPGCFERCLRGRPSYLRVQLEHNGHWVGRGAVWRDTAQGLCADLRLDDTEAGKEAAFKIRDGQTPGLSLAFRPLNGPTNSREVEHKDSATGFRKKVVHRKKIQALHHVALCQEPAYASAKVEAVRSLTQPIEPARLQYWREWTERVRRD